MNESPRSAVQKQKLRVWNKQQVFEPHLAWWKLISGAAWYLALVCTLPVLGHRCCTYVLQMVSTVTYLWIVVSFLRIYTRETTKQKPFVLL